MHPFEHMLRALAGGREEEQDETPEYTIPVPHDSIEELYRRFDESRQEVEVDDFNMETGKIPRSVDPAWRRYLFWEWVHDLLPQTRGHRCSVEMGDPLNPCIAVFGEVDSFFKDSDVITKCLEVPEEHLDRLWDLRVRMGVEYPSPRLANYYLWRELASIFPEVRVGNWQLTPAADGRLRVIKPRRDHEREVEEDEQFRKKLDTLTSDDFGL